jgi:hypothetical protein
MTIFVFTRHKKLCVLFGGNKIGDLEQEMIKPIRVHLVVPRKVGRTNSQITER